MQTNNVLSRIYPFVVTFIALFLAGCGGGASPRSRLKLQIMAYAAHRALLFSRLVLKSLVVRPRFPLSIDSVINELRGQAQNISHAH